jgi:hypothetical protein
MLNESKLWDESSAVAAKSYPPGEQLFQYFMVSNEKWSEAWINRAQLFLITSAILAIVGWAISSVTGRIIGFTLILMTPLTLGFTYGVLLADVLQAMLFAVAAIIPIMSVNDRTIHRLVAVLPTIFVMVIVKETSLILGIVVVMLVLHALIWGEPGNLLSQKTKVFFLGSVSLALLLPLLLWRLRMVNLKVNDPVVNLTQKIGFTRGESGVLQSVDSGVLNAVWEKLTVPIFPTIFNVLEGKLGFPTPKLSLFQLTLFLFAFNLLLILFKSKLRIAQTFGQATILMLGSSIFIGVHVVLYSLVFTSFEASSAVAFERYFSVYLIAWIAVLIGLTIYAIESYFRLHQKRNYRVLINSARAVFVCMLIFVMTDSRTAPQPPFGLKVRDDIRDALDVVKALSDSNDSIFFLYQEPSFMRNCQFNCGYHAYYAFRFEASPNTRLSPECAYRVPPLPGQEDCTALFDDQIGDFDYLVVMNATKELIEISDMFTTINLDEQVFQIFRIQDDVKNGFDVQLVRLATSSS